MKKKGILLVTAIASSLILAGCGQSTGGNDATNAQIINQHLGIRPQPEAARRTTTRIANANANERASDTAAVSSHQLKKKSNSCDTNQYKGELCKAQQNKN